MAGSELKVIREEEQSTALSTHEQQGDKLVNAAWMARELKKIIEDNGLAIDCGGKKKHLELEAWTTAARIQNEAPHAKFVRCFDDGNGNQVIEAHAWVTDQDGKIVAEADSFCSTEEGKWKNKPFFQRASMAQTRAMGKALRLRHSWIVVMAGYAPTPAEEMEGVEIRPAKVTVKDRKPKELPEEPPLVVPDEAVQAEGSYEPPRYDPEDPNIVDILVKGTNPKNGRGVCLQVADTTGKPIGEEVWWNTFHKGCFQRLTESKGRHVVVRISHKGDFTNIEEVVG